MGFFNKLIGSVSGNVAEVDAGLNAQVSTRQVNQRLGGETPAPNYVGATRMFSELDAGSVTGTAYLKSPLISEHRRLAVGMDSIVALYNFTPTTQNTGDFKHAFTTMTMTQSAGFLNVNPALATVSGNYAYLQTWKHFSLAGIAQTRFEYVLQASGRLPPANQVLVFGQFLGTAGVVPADGVFFRLTETGLYGVLSYSGNETPLLLSNAGLPAANDNMDYEITVSRDEIHFWINGIFYGDIKLPAAQAVPFLTLNLPSTVMMRNSNTVVGGITTKVGRIAIQQIDLNMVKPWAHQMATQGNAYQGQEGDAQGSVAMYSNAALGAAAAITNTTAAAPNIGLGGVVLVLPTLAAGTDGILFSYQNPAGSITQPPKTLVVTGITISGGVTVVLSAAAILNLVFSAAFGHTALSLATAETGSFVTATTKAPRRVPLGNLNTVIAAAAGTPLTGGPLSISFDSPLVVNPGEYFAITMRNVGVVTATGAIVVVASVQHYFE